MSADQVFRALVETLSSIPYGGSLMRIEQMEILSQLAETDLNQILLVQSRLDQKKYVIKRPRKSVDIQFAEQMLQREYQLLKSADLKHSIQPIACFRSMEGLCFAMEHFPGMTLQEAIGRGVFCDNPKLWIRIAKLLAEAIGEIHQHGIIHKDINPRNVLINESLDQIRLIDFGISTRLDKENPSLNEFEKLEGSVPYLAPEQSGRMNRAIDYRCDLYSLGITLFEAATGERPFEGKDLLEWVSLHLTAVPRPLHTVNSRFSSAISTVVAKLMAKHAEERYQSTFGLLKDIVLIEAFPLFEKPDFRPGNLDVPMNFAVSSKILGRDAEISEIVSTFEQMFIQESAQCIFISGASGIGKTAIVNEILKPLTSRRGVFLRSKYNQYRRDLPFDALVGIFSQYAERLLTLSEPELKVVKQRLLDKLDGQGKVLTDLIPKLALILGEQGELETLQPAAASERFMSVFNRFLDAISSRECPLIFFIDDLQWADNASLDCILELMRFQRQRYIFFIGAYRSSEVDGLHPLTLMLNQIETICGTLSKLQLKPLQESAVGQILSDSLRQPVAQVGDLLHSLMEKTEGNPFFVKEILERLYRDGAIKFEPESSGWSCSEDALSRIKISDNVVELVESKLRSHDAATVEMIGAAALVGQTFHLGDLSMVTGYEAEDLIHRLWKLARDGVVSPVDATTRLLSSGLSVEVSTQQLSQLVYQFNHDRIQQAAFSLLSEDRKRQVRLKLARHWYQQLLKDGQGDEKIVILVETYNQCRDDLENPAERCLLFHLNLQAAQHAKKSRSYKAGLQFAQAGLELHKSIQHTAESLFELKVLAAECAYYCQIPDIAMPLFEEILQANIDRNRKATVYMTLMELHRNLGHMEIVFDKALEALQLYGVSFPKRPSMAKVFYKLAISKWKMWGLDYKGLAEREHVQDETLAIPMQILASLYDITFQIDEALYAYHVNHMFTLVLDHGHVAGTAMVYNTMGIIHAAVLKDYETAEKLSIAGIAYGRRHENMANLGISIYLRSCFVQHWTHDLHEVIDLMREGVRVLTNAGEMNWIDYTRGCRDWLMILCSKNIADLKSCEESSRDALKLNSSRWAKPAYIFTRKFIALFNGEIASIRDMPEGLLQEWMNEDDWDSNMVRAPMHSLYYAIGEVLYGEYEAAHARLSIVNVKGVLGSMPLVYIRVLKALAAAHILKNFKGTPYQRRKLWSDIVQAKREIRPVVKRVPANFLHLYNLLEAEEWALKGQITAAMKSYDRALDAAIQYGYGWVAALVAERAFICAHQLSPRSAAGHLQITLQLYEAYGATSKVKKLYEQYSAYVQAVLPVRGQSPSTSHQSSQEHTYTSMIKKEKGTHLATAEVLDESSLIKASVALGTEVKIENLILIFLKILKDTAGAEKVLIFMPDIDRMRSQWFVRGSISVNQTEGQVQEDPAEVWKSSYSQAIFDYVVRSKETIVLDHACEQGAFYREPYIQGNRTASLICLPVQAKGDLVALLYMENNSVPYAFSAKRLSVLQALSRQAAVFIENSRLYSSLEKKVSDRTRELEKKSAEIGNMLRHLPQGLFYLVREPLGRTIQLSQEHSSHLRVLLGLENLANMPVEALLRTLRIPAGLADHLHSILDAVLNEERLAFDLNEASLPKTIEIEAVSGGHKVLAVQWSPIFDSQDRLEKILVSLRDETELRRLEHASRRQSLQIAAYAEILTIGIKPFEMFLDDAQLHFDHVMHQAHRQTFNQIDLNRHLHTLKGLFRSFHIQVLMEAAHRAEEEVKLSTENPTSAFFECLDTMQSAFQDYHRILGEIKKASGHRYEDSSPSVLSQEILANLLRHSEQEDWSSLRQELQNIQQIQNESRGIKAVCAPLLASVYESADKMEKARPRIQFEERDHLNWNDRQIQVLRDVMLHSLINSLDHGLEFPAERQEVGKDPIGTIVIRSWADEHNFIVEIEDDGRGLDLHAIRNRALKNGLIKELDAIKDEDLGQLIFHAGFSTAGKLTEYSGRGIGLDAVQSEMRELGGSIAIAFTQPQQTSGYRLFKLCLYFPRKLELVGVDAA